jgi:DNA helicase II / ATP-dependent DNA helicase PcrA
MDFTKRYQKLNSNQQQAVDTIEGPVMVIAGPGTGKTELLSMRAANILQKTDSLAENILCLTFTESGSIAMRKRLTEIIGKEAYNVSIFTFHAFGSEIIGKYREFFYGGAEFRPADELNQRKIIISILDSLHYNSHLRSTMNGEYTAIKDILRSISELKRAGLTNTELEALLSANQEVIDSAELLIREALGARISKTTLESLRRIAKTIANINEPIVLDGFARLSETLSSSIERAISEAEAHPKTTPPLTKWKNDWTTKNAQKEVVLKASTQSKKLGELAFVYGQYIKIMEQAGLYDYDDMIMQVVHTIETRPELRYDLQEKYHYIMVDEFQDTNMAQMRILHNLTNNPVVEDTPNILVVGDDDQAIYSFQGADVGNILHFKQKFTKSKIVSLVDNYRSAPVILSSARDVITQGSGRLEDTIKGLSKKLVAHKPTKQATASLVSLPTTNDERTWVVQSIKAQLAAGVAPHEIAIIARNHHELESLVGYLAKEDIKISYDKRDNVLENEIIQQLVLLSKIVISLYEGKLDIANELIPRLLTHPAWNIPAETTWKISLKAYKEKREWLEIISILPECKHISDWLSHAAQSIPHQPLERMLDYLIGTSELPEYSEFCSPLKSYFFSDTMQTENLNAYMDYLQGLTVIRSKLREHDPDVSRPRLTDFIHFINTLEESNTRVTSLRHIGEDEESIQLMSAHGSKGLEFDTVYVIGAVDSTWGEKASGKSPSISFPENMPIRAHSNSYNERLRLFYVAMTRAKRQLFVSYAHEDDTARERLIAQFLVESPHIKNENPEFIHTSQTILTGIEQLWYAPIVELPHKTMREYLDTELKNYMLSATHVNNFIDITQCGPKQFLLNNILHFPSSMSVHAEFGNAIHATLQQTHDYMNVHHKRSPIEDVLRSFEKNLQATRLTDKEHDDYLHKGSAALTRFLDEHYENFNDRQRAELQFRYQNVVIEDVRLTGKVDVVEINADSKTAIVTDYKTGASLDSWDKGADYQKVKAHKYRQQLLFYKLLIENSRDWHNYSMSRGIIQFIEPDKAGAIKPLIIDEFDEEELANFTQLIKAIWKHVQDLDFPDTSHYEQSIAGIRQFEQDLRDGTI